MDTKLNKRFQVFKGSKEGMPVLVTADPDYDIHLPSRSFSVLLSMIILYNKEDERGFPTAEDQMKIVRFEERIEGDEILAKSIFLAGTVTFGGKKELYYYCKKDNLEKNILDEIISKCGLRISYTLFDDTSFQEAKYYLGL